MLTVQNTEAIRRIEDAIGYTFNDKRLLVQVLTRKTYLKIDPEAPDNEVLEFYGDTLMNYHVTNYFMSKYAHMLDDGLFFMRTVEQFTDMRSHYVCNRYLTERVKALGLSRYLRAQNRDSELRRDGEKAYADIFESLVGAIYLDSYQNDTLIRAFILRQLGIEPKRLPADVESFDYDSLTTPIPSLPEVIEPVALEETETAADLPIEALTPSEVESASLEVSPAVEEHTIESEASVEPTVTEPQPAESPVVEDAPAESAVPVILTKQDALAALCQALGYELPTYGETPPNAPNARPVAACTLKYKDAKGKLVKISLNDSGKTLAEATEKAAAKMLKKLEKQAADAASKEAKTEKKAETVVEAAVIPAVQETPVAVVSAMETASVTETTEVVADVQDAPVAETESVVAEHPIEETSPIEESAATEIEPVAEQILAEEITPVAETAPVKDMALAEDVVPAEEVKAEKPVKAAKEKKAPAKKTATKSKKAEQPVEAAVAEPAVETVPEEPVAIESVPEAPATEVKPTKTRKSPARRKTTSKEDKSGAEAVASEVPADISAEKIKPAKKRAPAKKKAAPKADKVEETSSSDNN